ncbi:MAG: dihydrofolate reductase family protein [Fervidicoccaceae archaeon]
MQIRISMAMTADGKTADEEGEWYPLCPYERERLYAHMRWADAIVIGAETVMNTDISFMPPGSRGRPLRAIIDPSLRTDPSRKIYSSKRGPLIVMTEKGALEEKKEKASLLREIGAEVVAMEERDGRISAKDVVALLESRGLEKILVLGGGKTNYHFFREGLVDEYYITIVPRILGGSKYSPVSGEGFRFPGIELKLVEHKICECGNEIVLKYVLARRL